MGLLFPCSRLYLSALHTSLRHSGCQSANAHELSVIGVATRSVLNDLGERVAKYHNVGVAIRNVPVRCIPHLGDGLEARIDCKSGVFNSPIQQVR
jgi:hypothetical protein